MTARRPGPLRDEAARMLMHSSIVAELDAHEARLVIDAMSPMLVEAGTVIMEEGQTEDADYMALLLEGQVRAETASGVVGEEVVISILNPGQLIGEMGANGGTALHIFLDLARHLARHLLGRDTSTLLDQNRWRDEFLQKNAELFPSKSLVPISED